MTEEEAKKYEEETAAALSSLRTHRGWLYILDQVLDMRSSAIEECTFASRSNAATAEKKVMRAAMKIDAVDSVLGIFADNVELGITEEEKQVMGMK